MSKVSQLYCDLSVSRRSSLWLRQIIDLRDTGKSQYFAINEFNNCFIIQSPFFWSTKYVKSLSACSGNWSTISHKSVVSIRHEQNVICSKTLICSQLFAAHVVSSWANEKEGKNTLNDNNNYSILYQHCSWIIKLLFLS